MTTAQMDMVIRHLRRAVLRQDEAGWTDAQLLASFIDRKDEAAFEALVCRYGRMVFGVCRRVVHNHHDAEDAFQATFLVLARKASSVRPRERLASWLHGVALRTALKAKTITAKRWGREKQVTEMPEPEAARQGQWRDLQPLLDQELNGLPENYRLPILLCDLEGKSIKEATRQLGWPQGTLAGRLARGRKLLAKRLANRGVILSAGSLASVVSQKAASAAVPVSLMSSTVKAAVMMVTGQKVAGVAPAKVAILTEGVLKGMMLTKLKTVTLVLLVLGMVVFGGRLLSYPLAEGQQSRADRLNEEVVGKKDAFRVEVLPGTQTQRSSAAFTNVPTSQVAPPPRVADQREYAVVARLLEAGADWPEVISHPRMVILDGQPGRIAIADGTQNLLEKVVLDEKIEIGIFFDVRVNRLRGNKVRLALKFQRNEVEKSGVSEIHVLGNSAQAILDVELQKPVKVVFQKDARGSAQRWVEITVDEQTIVDEQTAPPPSVGGPQQKGGKK